MRRFDCGQPINKFFMPCPKAVMFGARQRILHRGLFLILPIRVIMGGVTLSDRAYGKNPL